MRIILLFLVYPFVAHTQVNHSASQLAHENIQEYLTTKIFKDQPYYPRSFGALKTQKEAHEETAWIMEHKFQVAEKPGKENNQAAPDSHLYRFYFFLDKKMRVVKAESIQE
ncbi:MAG TPA: hypothetical protein VJ499_13070 [Flavisolibacter sp.]|nr:hypothetical protein [Flavisolibacter sp.]